MASQSPNPFAAFLTRIVSAGFCLVGGKSFLELLRMLSSDRVIAGDGIDESPAPGGRVFSVAPSEDEDDCPYKVSVYQNTSGIWKVACARNNGYFIDHWHYVHEKLEGEDEKGRIVQNAPRSDFFVALRWTYSAYDSSVEMKDPAFIVKTGGPDAFDPFEQAVTEDDSSGISLCMLAYVRWVNSVPQVVQVVRNNLRAFWALKDGQQLGQLGDLLSAYKQKGS